MTFSRASAIMFRGLPVAMLLVAVVGCSGGGGGGGSSAKPPPASASSSPPRSSTAAPTTRSPTSSSVAPSKTKSKVTPVPVESNPPGDIPDNLAFVRYRNAAGRYTFTHPEGWAQTGRGTAVNFTDKLNGVSTDSVATTSAPTVRSARSTDVPRLRDSVPAFHLKDITAVRLPGGKGLRIVFRRNSAPDVVTGRVYRDEVEEYLVFSAGRLVRMDLYGPVGADNVDAYRTMSQSLRIR